MRIVAADVDVAGIVPALGAVLEQVDGADRKGLALDDGGGAAGRQCCVGHECEGLEGAARPKRSWARERVVDQVSALEVKAARAEIADFDRSAVAEAFLHRAIPLLDILRGGMRIERGEAYGGRRQGAGAEHWRAEI